MSQAKIVLVVASEGYHPVEYNEPKKILENAGFIVHTASTKKVPAIAKNGSSTVVNVTVDAIKMENYDGIFFIGGPGALENLDNQDSYDALQQAARNNIPLGAICTSSRILAKAGVLKGKHATGWDEDGQLGTVFSEHDVIYTNDKKVVVDGTIVTATGPDAAQDFGNQIVATVQDNKGWG